MGRILVVDDEPGVRTMLSIVLRREGHDVLLAEHGEAALTTLASDPDIELVLSDLRMDGTDGLELLTRHRKTDHKAFIIIMTAFAEWTTAVAAMRLGAYTFLRKPFDNDLVRSVIARALAAHDRHLAAVAAGETYADIHLVGCTASVQAVQQLIEQVSTTDSTVLVTGESGTGKELVARAVHYSSLRADGALVRVNSAALTPSLLESELFGHVKGAFTGAIGDRPGLFELADGGTLFLDEVGELTPETQAKLLRVLETGEYNPVGGRETRRANVRVVAATNRDLAVMVKAQTFREDLYYRLAVIPIALPPLRDRPDDIPLLAGNLLSRHAIKLRRGVTGFTPEAIDAMMAYTWPGNIRELDNRIQRGVAMTASGDIHPQHLFSDLPRPPGKLQPGRATQSTGTNDSTHGLLHDGGSIDLETTILNYERDLVQAALLSCEDNLTEAAKRLNISFRQMRYKVRQLGLR